MISIVNSINNLLDNIERWLVITSFSLMVIFSSLNVVLRALYTKFDIQFANIFLSSIDWSEPFARLMVLWITFLGASLLTKNNRHIRIDIMGHFLSPTLLTIREVTLSIACLIICFFMLRASIGYIGMEIQYGTSMLMGISAWKWQLIIPFGFFMMFFRFLVNLLNDLVNLFGKKAQ